LETTKDDGNVSVNTTTPELQAEFDRGVPVLLVKVGSDQLRPSALGIMRSLGRVGVAVNIVGERAGDPVAASRYVGRRLEWSTAVTEDTESLVAGLAECAQQIGRRSIVACTDDAAAIFIAEHRQELSEWLIVPPVPAGLPRSVATKSLLAEICRDRGVLTPEAAFPKTRRELEAFSGKSSFPVVVKSLDPLALRDQPLQSSQIVSSPEDLSRVASSWEEPFVVMLQEYLPRDTSEDWFVHAYAASSSDRLITFTGRKLRSWHPYAGFTAEGIAMPNEELDGLARKLLRDLDYKGPADLDWRRDLRDGGYRLLDFNPRFGRQFRIFQSQQGLDIARLLHLDMTSRPLPEVDQINGLRFIDDFFLVPSSYRIWVQNGGRRTRESDVDRRRSPSTRRGPRLPELAWFSSDDPMPFFFLIFRTGWAFVRRLMHRKAAGSRHDKRTDLVRR
jgi:D-aspartate ligase